MSDELKMSVSGALKNKSGMKVVYVTFEDDGRRAEGELPECRITRNSGFTKQEIEALQQYMASQKDTIMKMAQSVNPMKAFLSGGDKSL